MTPSLLPRLLIAAGMLRALARLLQLTAPMPDREAADACVHEGVEETSKALLLLREAYGRQSQDIDISADDQAYAVYMDTPDADTLLRWAEGWEQMAERAGKEG